MRTIKLSLRQRKKLHSIAEAIYARLVSRSSRFQPEINDRENQAVSVFTLGLIGLGLALGAGGGYLFAPQLTAWTGLAFFEGTLGPVATGAVGAVTLYTLISGIARSLSSKPLFQQMAELYIFNTKWSRPKRRIEMVRAVLTWLERQPEMTFEATDYLYGTSEGQALLPPKLQEAVTDLRGGAVAVVCVRDLFERKLKSEYLANGLESERDLAAYRDRYFLRSRAARNGIRASLLLNALGCELRDEIKTGAQWKRPRYTDERVQLTTIRDNMDVTLRYRTGAPHYRWPNDNEEKSDGETAPYLLYTAIENPAGIGLFTITVKNIMDRLPEAIAWQLEDEDLSEAELAAECDAVITLLLDTDIEMFGKWDERTLRQRSEVALIPQPVLKNLSGDPQNPDWALRWDPNRIDWSQFLATDGAVRRAFAALLKAVDLAEQDAEVVCLRRGDGLIIDNLRAMVRRRELGTVGVSYPRQVAAYPESWWLSVYYGFRKSSQPDFLSI
ncbi:MAG: hypothetical protein AAGH41_07885 [Pseudomonadota bacterium]